mgnify:CR=1 FL=1
MLIPQQAVEYFQRILGIESNNGEVWGALGHCYLMMDDLQKAYAAYQQALYHLPNPKVTMNEEMSSLTLILTVTNTGPESLVWHRNSV